jgi:cytochrome b pre-mRNA-processing protein 3
MLAFNPVGEAKSRLVMLRDLLFSQRPARQAGRALYAAVVEQARAPAFYVDLAAPDTVEGRFEIYTLHVLLLLDRLRRNGEAAAETAQSLFDTYVKALDHALREMGVGDLSVGRKMRRLGEAFYGRVKSLEAAFAALPADEDLKALLKRTVYAEAENGPVSALAAYVLAQRANLAEQPLDDLLDGRVGWTFP